MNKKLVRVLIIEDSEEDTFLLKRTLHMDPHTEYQIETTERLGIGLKILSQKIFDVVLTDLTLPDSKGKESFLKIRQAFPDLPIIVLTGLQDSELGFAALRAGVQDYLIKSEFLILQHTITRAIHYAIERKASELALIEREKALIQSQKLASIGTMAGGIAHEIKSPLATMEMAANEINEIILSDEDTYGSLKPFVGVILSMFERINKTVLGLKSFSRKSDADPFKTVSVKSIIDDSLTIAAQKLKQTYTDIQIKDFSPKISIECRSNQISQIFINLIENSCDAIANLNEKWIEIAVYDHAEEVVIHVTDSGQGIPESVSKFMFKTFFTTKDGDKGTGLGLSISKMIVQEHQGSIRLDKNCNHTRFIVQLPKTQNKIGFQQIPN